MKHRDVTIIAAAAHMANRAYCRSIGDDSQPHWRDAPEWQRNSAIVGVHAILSGKVATPADSHASWLAHKRAEGWSWGAEKDTEKKLHPCMVPYEDLPQEQRRKDEIFFDMVTALSVLASCPGCDKNDIASAAASCDLMPGYSCRCCQACRIRCTSKASLSRWQ